MDPLGTVALPLQRRLTGGAVSGLGAGLALDQPHGLAVGDVDGGKERETHATSLPSVHGRFRRCSGACAQRPNR
jgi:hypothetical protein